jgi:hypothetical protein
MAKSRIGTPHPDSTQPVDSISWDGGAENRVSNFVQRGAHISDSSMKCPVIISLPAPTSAELKTSD